MPAAVAIPLITGAAGLGAAALQAHAAKGAAQTQSDAANRAMAISQANTGQALDYITQSRAGVGNPMQTSPALARMYQGLGLGVQPGMYGAPGGSVGVGTAAQPIPAQVPQAQTITVQAPTGQTKQVPASQRDYWVKKGAKVV